MEKLRGKLRSGGMLIFHSNRCPSDTVTDWKSGVPLLSSFGLIVKQGPPRGPSRTSAAPVRATAAAGPTVSASAHRAPGSNKSRMTVSYGNKLRPDYVAGSAE